MKNLNFGTTVSGGAPLTQTIYLFNNGDQPLNVSSIHFVNGGTGFSLVGGGQPLAIPPLDSANPQFGTSTYALMVQFNPSAPGQYNDVLEIDSDTIGGAPVTIRLTGVSIAPAPTISFSAPQNNLGGVAVGASRQNAQLATITNTGAQPLAISSIQFESGNLSFALLGVPANLATNPLTLSPGQTFTFGVRYTASKIGLERAKIDVTTNDPNHPLTTFGVDGTGLGNVVYPHWGRDYVAIEFPGEAGSPALRAVSDDEGNFSIVLPPQQNYHIAIFDPITGLIANGYGTTPPSSQGIDLTQDLIFGPSTAPDTDSDGLPDDVEFAIGTSPTNAFTAGDGIDDFTHVILDHTDPLGGRALPTGVIASLALPGSAEGIAVQRSATNPNQQTAYVATGTGLAIVDATQFNKPVLLGQIALSGDNQGVAIDPSSQIAAVAAGIVGVNLVDVANPQSPKLLETVALASGANTVTVLDGLAFVTSGSAVISIDTATGTVVQTLDFGGGRLTGLARDGSRLVTMDANNTLRVVDVNDGFMTARGTIVLPGGGGQLFTGNGIVYATAANNVFGGYLTVDISNPDQPKLLSDRSGSFALPRTAFAANGSGIGLEIGVPESGGNVLDVLNVSDPTNTGQFLTTTTLPGPANALAIAAGMAYVAAGTAGLQVVNYEPFDTAGKPPTVSISTSLTDADPNTPGFQVAGGTLVPIQVAAADDVQVRNVELLVNGQVVQNQVSYPFDLSTVIPNPTPQTSTFTIQVRATDTGGNSSLSNVLTLISVPDTTPAKILDTSPPNGSSISTKVHTATIDFSKALNPATVNNATFEIIGANSQPVALSNIGLRNGGHTVQLVFASLPAGSFTLQIKAAVVTDLAGNPVGSANVTSGFTVVDHSIHWINSAGGDWNTPSNWDLGRVPGPSDDVVIDVPGNVTVTVSGKINPSINSLVCTDHLDLAIGDQNSVYSFTIAQDSEIDGGLSLDTGFISKLVANGQLTIKGNSSWTAGEVFGAGGVVNDGTLTLSGQFDKLLSGPLTNNGTIIHTGAANNGFGISPGGALLIQSSATLTNQTGAVYDFQDDLAEIYFTDQGGNFVNLGTVRKSQGTGLNSLEVNNFVNNGGGFDIETGEVALGATNVTNPGSTFQVTGAGFLDLLAPEISTTYQGTYDGSGGGKVRLISGTLVANTMTIGPLGAIFNFPAGMLDLNNGEIDATAGTLTNAGVLTMENPSLSGTFVNTGTILQTGQVDTSFLGATTITNSASGTYEMQGAAPVLDGQTAIIENGFTTTFHNLGALRSTTAGGDAALYLSLFDNQGTVEVDQGTLQIHGSINQVSNGTLTGGTWSVVTSASATINLTNAGNLTTNGGVVTLSGAGASFPNIADLATNSGSFSLLAGATFSTLGALMNSGTIVVGPGSVLTVHGTFTNTSTGVLDAQIAGTAASGQFGVVNVSGQAAFDGDLDLALVGGFVPDFGESYNLVTYNSESGTFATIVAVNIASGKVFKPTYNAADFNVTVAAG